MTRLKYFLSWFLVGAALPAWAASPRYAITPEQIAGAMAAMGMQVSSAQLTMITAPVASVAEPELRVQSMQRWPGDRVVARLDCATREQCLPFFVSIRMGKDAGTQGAMVNTTVSAPQVARATSAPAMAVRAGSRATLYMDGDHVHIRVAVVCLQSGAVGQTVRAEGPDHEQSYLAQVVGNGVLKGRF
ncbi:MAG: flagella basal body P-ring formation protein FlgA [Acidobacteriota bacterium]